MFRTASRNTHRAPGRAVVDYRGLAAPVGKTLGGAAALGAMGAGVAIGGAAQADAVQPSVVKAPARTLPAAAPAVRTAALTVGSRGTSVTQLQSALNARGASLAVDGRFGSATLQAVRAFQSQSGLAVDGKAGPRTWAALNGSGSGSSSSSTASSGGDRSKVRVGSRGADVTELQNQLRARGATFSATGYFGSSTKAAVIAFQRSAGLTADGVVGPQTWSALAGGGGSVGGGGSSSGGASSSGGSSSGSVGVSGNAIIDDARAQLGVRYVWGASKPGVGFDCSGLTQHVYKKNGITIPRTASAQVRAGTIISESEARPGDLVAFTAGNYGHIGVYLGNGRIVDAGSSKGKVVERAIWNSPHVFVTYR